MMGISVSNEVGYPAWGERTPWVVAWRGVHLPLPRFHPPSLFRVARFRQWDPKKGPMEATYGHAEGRRPTRLAMGRKDGPSREGRSRWSGYGGSQCEDDRCRTTQRPRGHVKCKAFFHLGVRGWCSVGCSVNVKQKRKGYDYYFV